MSDITVRLTYEARIIDKKALRDAVKSLVGRCALAFDSVEAVDAAPINDVLAEFFLMQDIYMAEIDPNYCYVGVGFEIGEYHGRVID